MRWPWVTWLSWLVLTDSLCTLSLRNPDIFGSSTPKAKAWKVLRKTSDCTSRKGGLKVFVWKWWKGNISWCCGKFYVVVVSPATVQHSDTSNFWEALRSWIKDENTACLTHKEILMEFRRQWKHGVWLTSHGFEQILKQTNLSQDNPGSEWPGNAVLLLLLWSICWTVIGEISHTWLNASSLQCSLLNFGRTLVSKQHNKFNQQIPWNKWVR